MKEEKHFNNKGQNMQNLGQQSVQNQMVNLKAECDKFMSEQVKPLNVLGLQNIGSWLFGGAIFKKEETGGRITDWKYKNIFTKKNN